MGGLEKRLEVLEGLASLAPPKNTGARARMRAYLDEIAAARREGREPSEEAETAMEAIKRRRELRYES